MVYDKSGLDDPIRLTLSHGTLITMEGFFQQHYTHEVPPNRNSTGVRVNLTFRNIVKHTMECTERGDNTIDSGKALVAAPWEMPADLEFFS